MTIANPIDAPLAWDAEIVTDSLEPDAVAQEVEPIANAQPDDLNATHSAADCPLDWDAEIIDDSTKSDSVTQEV